MNKTEIEVKKTELTTKIEVLVNERDWINDVLECVVNRRSFGTSDSALIKFIIKELEERFANAEMRLETLAKLKEMYSR